MQQKVENYIQKQQLLTRNGQVIVGVSGGTDSVALLHILVSLGYDCVIAHCNFHLRMEESSRDEAFVRNLAHNYNLPYYIIDFKTIKYANEHKISIEMAARELRYNWFYELLEKLDAQAIAVAHHADDSIETMLMNLVRGTGLRGLAGITSRNKKVVRPLLCCTRLELEEYLVNHNLDHIEDSTNATSDYKRNKFRNEVLPLLTEINPSVRQTLYNSLEYFEGSLAIYQQAIDNIEKVIVHKQTDLVKMDIEIIKEQVDIPTVMYELLHPYGFNSAQIAQITEQLDGESGKQFNSETYHLVKDRKYLILYAKEQNTTDLYSISQSDNEIFEPISLKISKLAVNTDFKPSKKNNCVHLDSSKLSFPLQLRRWTKGDTFYPFGMNKRKKISDFFIDNKFSLQEKEQTWLLVSGSDIVWIVGKRVDNRFRVTKETSEVIEIRVNNEL
ncbi:MAG: tRNA lysidine(34) synthetase TilS [Paludibacter sp.]|nr:tRNA lysidine(34) synthetase TilS [Paludibacter sp.]